MNDEELLKHAQNALTQTSDEVEAEWVTAKTLQSIAASLLVIARHAADGQIEPDEEG